MTVVRAAALSLARTPSRKKGAGYLWLIGLQAPLSYAALIFLSIFLAVPARSASAPTCPAFSGYPLSMQFGPDAYGAMSTDPKCAFETAQSAVNDLQTRLLQTLPLSGGTLTGGLSCAVGSTCDVSGMSATLPSGPAQTLQQLLKYRVRNWTEFGSGACQGNAVADTAAFQAAVAFGGRLTFKCDQPILLNDGAVATKWTRIEGENLNAEIRLTAAFPQTSDVVTLRPTTIAGEKYYGWGVTGLKINAVVAGRGRHGIVIDLSAGGGAQMTGLTVERNQIGDVIGSPTGYTNMGGAAIRFIPNATQADQFYVSSIRQNYLNGGPGFTDGSGNVVPGGGIYMRRAGDSIHIDENWIKGQGRAIDVGFVTGAANFTVHRNNLTASGGSIRLTGGLRGSILDNQIELLSPWTGDSDQAMVVLDGCDGTAIDGNNVNADLGDHSAALTADGFSLLGATARTDIRAGNRVVVNGSAGRVHLRTSAASTVTTWWPGQRIENPFLTISTRQNDVLATSIGTPGTVRGLWFAATLLNGWTAVSTGGATYEGLFYKVNPDGRVSLRGNVTPGTLTAGTSIATLPDDVRGAKTVRIFPKQAQSGNSYLPLGFQLNPGGSLLTTYAVPNNLPVSFDDVSYNPTAN